MIKIHQIKCSWVTIKIHPKLFWVLGKTSLLIRKTDNSSKQLLSTEYILEVWISFPEIDTGKDLSKQAKFLLVPSQTFARNQFSPRSIISQEGVSLKQGVICVHRKISGLMYDHVEM